MKVNNAYFKNAEEEEEEEEEKKSKSKGNFLRIFEII
jgi:hypothetical protein